MVEQYWSKLQSVAEYKCIKSKLWFFKIVQCCRMLQGITKHYMFKVAICLESVGECC